MVKWNKILYTLVNITGLQFFGRDDPAASEFFDSNHLGINVPLKANEQSLRVRMSWHVYDLDSFVFASVDIRGIDL